MLRVPPSLSSLLPGTLQVPLQINGQTLELGNSATFTGATNQILATSTQVIYNVVAAQKHNFAVGGSGKAEISSTGLFLSGSGELLNLGASGPLGSSISSSYNTISGRSTGLEITSATGLPIKFFVYTSEYERISSGGLHEAYKLSLGGTLGSSTDPGAGALALTNRVQFVGAGTVDTTKTLIHADAADGNMRIQTPAAKSIVAWIGTFQAFAVDSGGIYPGNGIIFSNSAGVANSAQTQIYPDAANGNLLINVPSTKSLSMSVAGNQIWSSDATSFTITKNITCSNNSNTGNRVANLDVQRYFNNVFWGWPNNAYTCSMGSFDGAGYPFICFYGYHSSTTNTIKRSSAYNQPVWLQSLGGYLSIWQGSSGTADTDCTGTEKYRFDSIFQTDRMSIGTTMGSPVDQGSGGFYCTGNMKVNGTITMSGSNPSVVSPASGSGVYLRLGAGSADIATIIQYTNAYDGGTRRGCMEILSGQVAGGAIRIYDKDTNQQLDISEAGCVSVRQNSGGRTANFSACRHYNSFTWGHTNTEYFNSIGAFSGGGQGFIAFYAYHSTTASTLARASATNVATWIQAETAGYMSFWQGNTGTVNGDITGTEKYRFGASLLETSAASFGGTIGSSSNPGAGGIYAAGNINFRGGQKCGVAIKTTTYTATVNDYVLLGNHATTAFTINLPAATGTGQVFVIKNIGAATVTVDANASETIDGSLTQDLTTNQGITIVDYATGLWAIVAAK